MSSNKVTREDSTKKMEILMKRYSRTHVEILKLPQAEDSPQFSIDFQVLSIQYYSEHIISQSHLRLILFKICL